MGDACWDHREGAQPVVAAKIIERRHRTRVRGVRDIRWQNNRFNRKARRDHLTHVTAALVNVR